jgi:hypothetical protein
MFHRLFSTFRGEFPVPRFELDRDGLEWQEDRDELQTVTIDDFS